MPTYFSTFTLHSFILVISEGIFTPRRAPPYPKLSLINNKGVSFGNFTRENNRTSLLRVGNREKNCEILCFFQEMHIFRIKCCPNLVGNSATSKDYLQMLTTKNKQEKRILGEESPLLQLIQ